jgi:hypothetical protein
MHPMSIPVNCDQQLAVCDDHRVRGGAKPRATARCSSERRLLTRIGRSRADSVRAAQSIVPLSRRQCRCSSKSKVPFR